MMQAPEQEHQEPIPDEAAALLDQIEDEPGQDEPGQELATQIPSADLIRPLVVLVCTAVVPAWKIGKAEQDTLAEAYGAVLDKYFPGGIEMGPELGAVLVTAAIIMPRLGQPMRDPEPEPEPGQDESGNG
jgi:hypothetical protein